MSKQKTVLKPRAQTSSKGTNSKELKGKFNVGKRLPLIILTLFALAGAVVGGYVLLRSSAEGECVTSPTASGHNACVSIYYVPNVHPGVDCTVGAGATLDQMVQWQYQKMGKNVFINEPPRSYLFKESTGWRTADLYYQEYGCQGYSDQGVIVMQMKNTGTTAWDVSKVIGDPAGVHMHIPNIAGLDFGSKFHSMDTVAPGYFLLQRYAYKGAMPDPKIHGTSLSSYNIDCPNNSCLKPGDLVQPGETIWTSTVIYYGNAFTTNGNYSVEFQMMNNNGALFGNKISLPVTARAGGGVPPNFASKAQLCLLQVGGKVDPNNKGVIANFAETVTGANPASCTQAQYDESGFNPAKPSTASIAPKVKAKPAPQGVWNQ